jgi:adenosylcobinamide-phosphate synthase
MELVIVFVLAIGIDIIFGEPPNICHPVAWLGKLISAELYLAPRKGKCIQLLFGILAVLFTMMVITALFYFLLIYLQSLNTILYIVVSAIIFKFTFSLKGLRREARTVKTLIAQDKIIEARARISALVGRDTSGLEKGGLISATIESVAENSCDSFVAPLFFFILLGVPGAVAYRIVNTFDAMIGYRGKWEYLGKFAAIFDDIVNYIPARIAALIIMLSTVLCKKNPAHAWHVMLRDHNKTESPNAGWTMSALAGALGVRLEKEGCYRLGDNDNILSITSIDDSLKMILIVAIIWSFILLLVQVVYCVTT